MTSEWAKAQVDRVQGPVYAAKAAAARRAKRRAKFDGIAEYRGSRRMQRREAFSACLWRRFDWEHPEGPW